MSPQSIRQVPRMFYRSNLQTALMRRVYPRTLLHRKVLAAAIGRHVDTIDRIMAGEGSASLEVIGDLSHFFRKQGDHSFLPEVFGGEHEPSSAPVAPAQIAAELEHMARRMRELIPA